MKKVVIIGGGIAGLTAGILLQEKGIQSEIYEKNLVLGGECTGWKRKGYIIDNCIHWLTGSKEGSKLHDLWVEVGALGNGIKLRKKEMFFSSSFNGQTLTFYRDLEKTRKELLELSPIDKDEINKLCDYVKLSEDISVPVDKPFDQMNLMELTRLGLSMKNGVKVMKAYSHMNIKDLALSFKHPLIQKALTDYMPENYQAYAFLVSYATVTAENGDVPVGGSLEMIQRMVNRYISLGGKTFINTPVDKIIIDKKNTKGVLLENGTKVACDEIIVTLDPDYTFHHLLPTSYLPKSLKKQYDAPSIYPSRSGFQMAFAIDGQFKELAGNRFFSCQKIKIGTHDIERINIYAYDYEPNFAPQGKMIIQTNILQNKDDYDYWKELSVHQDLYLQEKQRSALEVKDRIITEYPFLKDKISLLDVWTPFTYQRYCHAYEGAYMSFTITKTGKSYIVPGTVKPLKNVYLASQWQMSPGGLPTALAMGKFAAWRILKKEKLIK